MESAWSIQNKFQWLNRLPYPVLLRTFGRPTLPDAEPEIDLRFASSIDVELMSRSFQIPPDRIERAFPPIEEHEMVRLLFARLLRYCPTCLVGGFHATLHQCLLLIRCPIHNARLRQRCPRCRRPIAYRLNASNAANPYACPGCRSPLATGLNEPRARPQLPSPEQVRLLEEWMRFLRTQIDAQSLPRRPFGMRDSAYAAALFRRLRFVREAQALFFRAPPIAPVDCEAGWRLARRWLHAPDPNRSVHPLPPGLRYARRQWKGFRGEYVRLERRYAAALVRLTCRLDVPVRALNAKENVTACSFGFAASVLWRMAWEGVVYVHHLDQHHHPAFGIAVWLTFRPAIATRPTDRKILAKDFDAILERTLGTAIAVTHFMRVRGTYLFERRLVAPLICDYARSLTFGK